MNFENIPSVGEDLNHIAYYYQVTQANYPNLENQNATAQELENAVEGLGNASRVVEEPEQREVEIFSNDNISNSGAFSKPNKGKDKGEDEPNKTNFNSSGDKERKNSISSNAESESQLKEGREKKRRVEKEEDSSDNSITITYPSEYGPMGRSMIRDLGRMQSREGLEYFNRYELPPNNHNCGLYGIYGRNDITRERVVNQLLNNATLEIRRLMAWSIYEIVRDIAIEVPNREEIPEELRARFNKLARLYCHNNLTIEDIIEDVALFKDFVSYYIGGRIGNGTDYYMLGYDRETHAGAMAAIAAVNNIALNIYIQSSASENVIECIFSYVNPRSNGKIISLLHTGPVNFETGRRIYNHFQLLMPQNDSYETAQESGNEIGDLGEQELREANQSVEAEETLTWEKDILTVGAFNSIEERLKRRNAKSRDNYEEANALDELRSTNSNVRDFNATIEKENLDQEIYESRKGTSEFWLSVLQNRKAKLRDNEGENTLNKTNSIDLSAKFYNPLIVNGMFINPVTRALNKACFGCSITSEMKAFLRRKKSDLTNAEENKDHLSLLPLEILFKIIEYLDNNSILILSSVNRHLINVLSEKRGAIFQGSEFDDIINNLIEDLSKIAKILNYNSENIDFVALKPKLKLAFNRAQNQSTQDHLVSFFLRFIFINAIGQQVFENKNASLNECFLTINITDRKGISFFFDIEQEWVSFQQEIEEEFQIIRSSSIRPNLNLAWKDFVQAIKDKKLLNFVIYFVIRSKVLEKENIEDFAKLASTYGCIELLKCLIILGCIDVSLETVFFDEKKSSDLFGYEDEGNSVCWKICWNDACLPSKEEYSLQVVQLLEELGYSFTQKELDRILALAVKESYEDLMKLSIELGADIHMKFKEGCTLMHRASMSGNLRMMFLLAKLGVEADILEDGLALLEKGLLDKFYITALLEKPLGRWLLLGAIFPKLYNIMTPDFLKLDYMREISFCNISFRKWMLAWSAVAIFFEKYDVFNKN